jgi:hypothetical protein
MFSDVGRAIIASLQKHKLPGRAFRKRWGVRNGELFFYRKLCAFQGELTG